MRVSSPAYRPASPRARMPHPVGTGMPAPSVVRPTPAPAAAPAPATGLKALALNAWHCLQDWASPPSKPEPTGGSGHHTYTVQPGDTLSKIAKAHLGDLGRWGEIFEANRDQISNPNLIFPGQVLKLPESADHGHAPAPAPAPAPSEGSGPLLRKGASGEPVRRLQDRLRELGFDPGATDGAFGPMTLNAVNAFQGAKGLTVDGIVGPQTWKALGIVVEAPPAPPQGQWQLPVPYPIGSRDFGMHQHPIQGGMKMHTGVDIGAPSGTPIKNPAPGRVVSAGWNGGYGNYVVVDHGNGIQSCYAHLAAIHVSNGQHVDPGAVLGTVGSTGNSTGPHLHLEVKRHGEFVDPRGFFAG